MQDFNAIPKQGTFGTVVDLINANFSLAKVAISGVEYSTQRNKGFFVSSTALTTAIPSPKVGDWALVKGSGSTAFPAAIYVCQTAGTWADSGETYTGDTIDLANYLTIAAFNTFKSQLDTTLCGFNTQVATNNAKANKVIKKMFVDTSGYTGSYSLNGLKLRLLSNGYGGSWGIQITNGNDDYIYYHWEEAPFDTLQDTMNGVFVYADFLWSEMSENERIAEIQFNANVFSKINDPRGSITNSKIKNGEITLNKMASGALGEVSPVSNGLVSGSDVYTAIQNAIGGYDSVYTDSEAANAVIKHLFVDTSGYTGTVSLTGLYARILARNYDGSWGILFCNENDDPITQAWMYNERPSQIITNDGLYIYIKYDWSGMEDGERIYFIHLLPSAYDEKNDPRGNSKLSDFVYGAAGDSITEGAGLTEYLDADDPYNPASGTAKATYAYYIAKKENMRWYNYGMSGSTLGNVTANGITRSPFSGTRYTAIAQDVTHLSIFFGWNDDYYGEFMKREDWLLATYGTKIYWTYNQSLIGTIAADGTPYVTQAQYTACNAHSGTIGGVTYTGKDYFYRLYLGTINDTGNSTFYGAYNTVIKYYIENRPYMKLLLIVPYETSALMRQAVRDVADKWGLPYYDFYATNQSMFWDTEVHKTATVTIDGQTVNLATYRRNINTADTTHPNANGYKYMFPAICAKLMSI